MHSIKATMRNPATRFALDATVIDVGLITVLFPLQQNKSAQLVLHGCSFMVLVLHGAYG